MTNYATVSRQAREQFDLDGLIDTDAKTTRGQYAEAALIARQWRKELTTQFGVSNITDDEEQFATMTFNAWLRDQRLDRPVIIAAPPAFGKSSMLALFLRTMCAQYPDTFSALVVKERVADIEALRDEINDYCGAPRAFAIKGYDSSTDNRLDYEEQFFKQRDYNVVLMTTKQLERQAMRDNLSSFTEFITEDGRSLRRSLLLIDEKPSLVLSHTLSARNLNDFMSDVLEVSRDHKGRLKSYYNRVRQLVDELRSMLESPETKAGELPAIASGYTMPVRLVRDFAEAYGHDRMTTLRAVERVINAGGEYSNGVVTSTHVVHYKYTLFHTYILDGTGATDPDYMSSDFYTVQPMALLDYSNVTFRVCDSYNLSRTALRQSPQSVEAVVEMTRQIIAEHKGKKTLVVSYMENVAQLESELAAEIKAGQARVKHFDGGRGSNDYVDCDNAVYIGSLFKGTAYYTTASQAVIGDRMGVKLDTSHTITGAGLTFDDEYTEGYKRADIAVNLVQETNRLRASRKPGRVTIYLFNRDADMIDIIRQHYPLAKFEEYVPLQKLTGKKTAIDAIIDYFAAMKSGERVKQSAIYRELEISRHTFARQAETERFQQALEKYRITKEKTSYTKV
ncbi:hypothetical protein [Sporosarcina highlanderae]|uniref:Uncharacterized protein n=1 Tax=Sporosarcina highlanderae TaxID=3035916 RepID=A0ABT8JU06_9BACL|nr:hypothetical protein [Sporosarcina highlanderae]MDN4608633.1 hypothetical protein [Sporosarcina highlanderae]